MSEYTDEIERIREEVSAEIRADVAMSRRQAEEEAFSELVRDYVADTCNRFAFGGVVNALNTIASACSELSMIEDDDWERAAVLIEDFSNQVDLKYGGEK